MLFVEPLVTSPVKASSFRDTTFIKTQKLYTLQFHCQWEFFQNFSCKIYVADAEKHWPFCPSTDENWPPEATVARTRHSPTLSWSSILLTFINRSNFFWLRREERGTSLWNQWKAVFCRPGIHDLEEDTATPGPWPPDHKSLPHSFWEGQRALASRSRYIFCLSTCMLI